MCFHKFYSQFYFSKQDVAVIIINGLNNEKITTKNPPLLQSQLPKKRLQTRIFLVEL